MLLVTLHDAHIVFGNCIGPAKSGPLFRPTTGYLYGKDSLGLTNFGSLGTR
jgi:hypothetical protein